MKFSTLKEIQISNDVVGVFGGYNHNLNTVADGEFYDMKNLTSDFYPAISPRKKRGTFTYPGNTRQTHKANAIFSKEKLCYFDGNKLYINNSPVNTISFTDSKKQIVTMGSYVIVLPDKKYVNSINFSDCGSLDREFISTPNKLIYVRQCDSEGNNYNIVAKSATAPSNPSDGDCYIDTSNSATDGTTEILMYYANLKKWKKVEDVCVKLTFQDTLINFEEGDEAYLSDLNTETVPVFETINDKKHIIKKIIVSDDDEAENTTSIVFEGYLNSHQIVGTLGYFRLTADMPVLDFVIESGNRLWGCRYGYDNDTNFVNEIYASKLGDFKRWNCFNGISTDSYTASCGSEGAFTGAISHQGYPLFFKENYIHKVYGNYPSNYQIQTSACNGVMKGCAGSLVIANESLIYKSRNGVCLYDGSIPKEISSSLGNIRYSAVDDTNTNKLYNGAVAGFYLNKYYISMKSEIDSNWHFFVFDVSSGLWHKEDNLRADAFCQNGDELYYIDYATKQIKTILGSGTQDSDAVEWSAETGVIGVKMKENKYTVSLVGKKYISKLLVRMSMDVGSRVMFYIQYDSCGEWEHVATLVGTTLKSFMLPIKAKRCDHFKLKFEGIGEAKIYSITKSIEKGSEY